MTPSATSSTPKLAKHPLLTERVDRIVAEKLSGERIAIPGVRDASLTPIEQRLSEELEAELREGRHAVIEGVCDTLWNLDYVKRPPNIEEFILKDYYLGKTWGPVKGENDGIWPEWLRLFSQHLNIDSVVHNIVLTGSLGTGKTALMVTAILYRMCIATHLKNPQHFFGLNRNSKIVYNFLSVTKEAVKDTAFGTAMSYMGDSAYFREECKFNPDLDYSGYRIPMLNQLPDGRTSDIWLSAGSKGQHVLGRNLVGIGLDEGNFRLEKDPDLTAYQLYDQVRTRIANRFQKIKTFLPALSIIASSAQDESSFTEKVVGEIEESNRLREIENRLLPPDIRPEQPSQIVIRNAVYKIKRHALPGIGPDHHWFKVAYGLKNMEPFILSGWYREDGTPILEDKHEEPPNGAKTEMVPKFYWEAYRRNCKSGLQNLSGISVGGAHRLFSSMIDIEWCLEESVKEGVPDPMQPGINMIPISAEDNKNIWDYLQHDKFLTRVASRIQPLRHPQSQRYAHLDLATQTMAGLSICHLAGSQKVDGLVKDGEPFSEYRLVVEYDFILTICAGQNKPINFSKIQKFFFWLRDMCSYRFGLITADMWNSVMPLQELEARGFLVKQLSIDRDKTVYTGWRAGFEEHRIRLHRNQQMIREAENLLEMDKKFDHPMDGGSKDTCLALSEKVLCLDGKTRELGKIKAGTSVWVYGLKDGSVVATKALALGITRKQVPLLAVTLDNDRVVKCTPDHLFMLRDGSYRRADALTSGTSLMPFYFNRLSKGYGSVFNPSTHRFEKVYSLVDQQVNGPRPAGYTVHHRNMRKKDDRPTNLQRMTNAEHWALHRKIEGPISAKTEEVRQRNLSAYNALPETKEASKLRVAHARKFCDLKALAAAHGQSAIPRLQSKEYRENHSKFISNKIKSDHVYKAKILAGILASNAARKKDIPLTEIVALRNEGKTNYDIAEQYGVGVSLIERRVAIAKKQGFTVKINHARGRSQSVFKTQTAKALLIEQLKTSGMSQTKACAQVGMSFATYKNWLAKLNHKVIKVEVIGDEDVTCLRTETGNFALEAGVFVHNCDGASGSFYNAVTSDEKLTMASTNAPTIYTGRQVDQFAAEPPPIAIPVPAQGYTRSRLFKV